VLHLDRDVVARALGIPLQLDREVLAELHQGGGEVVEVGHDLGGPVGEERDLVVRRHAAVRVEPVEGLPRRPAQHLVGLERLEDGIGRDDNEHRGEAGRQHAGALRHAADRPAVAADHGGLRDRVGGHDGLCGELPAVGAELGDRLLGAGEHPSAESLVAGADEARGADQHVAGADAEELGRLLGRLVRGLEPERPGEAVRSTGVEHDGLDHTVGDGLLRPDDRVRLGAVAREDGRSDLARSAVDDDGDIGLAGGLEPHGHAGRLESCGGGDAHCVASTIMVRLR